MSKYSLDKLVKVQVVDPKKSTWYSYENEINFLGFTIRKKGVYSTVLSREFIGKIPENHSLIKKEVYENPYVLCFFGGDIHFAKYFKTLKEANEYSDSLTKGNWIKVD